MNTLMGFKLYDYVLTLEGKLTGEVTKLGMHEAQKLNFAYALNRSPRRYVLKSEVDATTTGADSILIVPEG
jgi:hypothetical protein